MPSYTQVVLLTAFPALCFAMVWSLPLQQLAQGVLVPWIVTDYTPRVVLEQGVIMGSISTKNHPPVEVFMGFPYAQPPTNDRRFRRAVALSPSNQTFNATAYGPICPGKQLLAGKANPSSEDCMTVNIFRQKPQGSRKVPVAVYIHGGAFNRGSSMMHNTASMVAWSEKAFIGVSFNYRIGALGFLPSKATFEEGIVNIGLHDQIFLLQWVQDNIGAFGGDKNDVTIFGLSAGAHSIGHHILNYQYGIKPLFHKAIMESGSPTSRAQHRYDAAVHEEQYELFLQECGCAEVPKEATTNCLRNQTEKTIVTAQEKVFNKYNPSLRWAFQPVVDGELLQQRPIDQWAAGKWHKVPIMTGHTTNEGSYYVPAALSTSDEFTDFWHTLLPHYTSEDLAIINRLYPDPDKVPGSRFTETRNMTLLSIGPQYKRVEAAYAHYAYACPVRQSADIVSTAQEHPPVFVYHWAVNKTMRNGANHGDNMYYESYPHEVTSISEATREISGIYHAYVTSFITDGHPNAIKGRFASRPKWEEYIRGEDKVMILGNGNDERAGGIGKGVPAEMVGSEWIKAECDFWWRKSHDTEE